MTAIDHTFYQDITTQLVKLAMQEDLGPDHLDCTNQCLFKHEQKISTSRLVNKESKPIVFCGLELIKPIFQQLNTTCEIDTHYTDGDVIAASATIAKIHAPMDKLLTAERTILNFTRHLSAIATLTKHYVDKVKHTSTQILDTRKTTPGMRYLEKYAVGCGGGVNHRMGLFDAVMVKDTHIDLMGGIDNMLTALKVGDCKDKPIIIEIRHQHELQHVLQQHDIPVERVLLDNMNINELAQCVTLAKSYNICTEASGNIHLDTIAAIAETGVDYASVGRLTHSAGQVDLAMKI